MKKFFNALSFLTIIPLPGHRHTDLTEAGKSAAYFPVVGLVIGLLLWAAAYLSGLLWSSAVQAVIVISIWAIITAGMHIDGLADLADGIGGGWDVESRLRIMKDSAIGTYGALAAVILLLMKAVLVYELSNMHNGSGMPLLYSALIVVPAAGRSCQVLGIRVFKPAKKEGFGFIFKSGVRSRDAAAAVFASLVAATAFWGWTGAAVFFASVLFMLAAGKWISVRLGGLNGDSYGALCELSELFLLIVISVLPLSRGWLSIWAG